MAEHRIAIITGGSAGIGAATAIELGKRGDTVVLAARREDKLRQVADRVVQAGGSAEVIPTDVSDEEQVDQLVARTVETFGRLDVMINNAGFGAFGQVHELSTEAMRDVFEANYFGLFFGARAAARQMIAQGRGHIFNVSSVIGKRGTPYHGAYCATKFAIVGLSDAMRVELKSHNIHVTTVCPTLTKTEFFEHSRRGQAAKGSFKKFKSMMTPQRVGRDIVRTIGKNKPELVFSGGGKLLVFLSAVSPRLVDWMMGFYARSLAKSIDGGQT